MQVEFVHDVGPVRIHRLDADAERDRELLELDRERHALDQERVVIERGRSTEAVVQMFMGAARKDPRLLDAAEMLCKAIIENTEPAVLSYVFPSERKSSTAFAAGEAAQPGAPTGSSQIKVN